MYWFHVSFLLFQLYDQLQEKLDRYLHTVETVSADVVELKQQQRIEMKRRQKEERQQQQQQHSFMFGPPVVNMSMH